MTPKKTSPEPTVVARVSRRTRMARRAPDIMYKGRPRKDCRLQVYGSLWGDDSFNGVSASLARALIEEIDGIGIHNYLGGEIGDPALASYQGLNRNAPVGLFIGLPEHIPDFFYLHRIRIGVFVCEGDRIPDHWVATSNRLDLIIVPSTFCQRVFIQCGTKTPVMVVPHGVSELFVPRPGLLDSQRFVFYNSFRGNHAHHRKSYSELVTAFLRAFAGRDDVVLRLKVGNTLFMPRFNDLAGFESLVELDTREGLDPEENAALYSRAHCVVHPSKCEGFGLVPLESICCETPVIAPATTGLADYLNEGNAMVLKMGGRVRARAVDHHEGRHYTVDEDALVEALRYAVDNYDAEKKKLEQQGEQLRQQHAWSNVLSGFLHITQVAVDSPNRTEFSLGLDTTAHREAVESAYDLAERRARSGELEARRDLTETTWDLPFKSVIYCCWDYPRDGIGNHMRLLDSCVFNVPDIRYRTQGELASNFSIDYYPPVYPNLHLVRQDLFEQGLFLDVVGFQGGEETIYRQIEHVAAIRRCYGPFCAIYLMWETDRLWAPMLDLVKAYDLVIVTSDLLKEYFAENDVNYVKVPHPYNFHVNRSAPRESSSRPLRIGISAGLWARKNLSLAASCFTRVLGNNPDYVLSVHTRTSPFDAASVKESETIQALAREFGNIEYTVQSFTREDYLDWMNSLDAYCFISSGEGYSVTPREALHLGKPVILLDAHVHSEFSHLPGVIRVPSAGKSPARPGFSIIDADIGKEFDVDEQTLEKVFSRLDSEVEIHARALRERFQEVLDFHDPATVRTKWLTELKQAWFPPPAKGL